MEEKSKFSFNFGPLFIAFAAFLWTTDAFVRTSLNGKISPIQLVFVDHLIIILIISPLVFKYIGGLGKFSGFDWFALLFIGIGGSALATIALTAAFYLGRPFEFIAVIVLLQQTQPIIAIGLAKLLLKEKLPSNYIPLSLVAIIGVYLINFPSLSNQTNTFSGVISIVTLNFSNPLGVTAALLGLTAAVLWGASTVFGRYLLEHSQQKLEFQQMTTFRFLIAFIFLTVLVTIPNSVNPEGFPNLMKLSTDVSVLTSLLYLSIVVGLLSLLIYYFGLKRTKASVSTIFELAYPFSLFILLPLFNSTPLTMVQYVGAIILILSTTILSYSYSLSEQTHLPTPEITL